MSRRKKKPQATKPSPEAGIPAKVEKQSQTASPSGSSAENELETSEQQRKLIASVVRTITRKKFYSGPLPRPDMLKAYDECCPGAAQTIMSWVAKEQNGRIWNIYLGKILAFLYGLGVCGVAIYSVHRGHPHAASIVMGLNVAAVCVGFVAERKK
jgi:uncharacterized membrane protein